MGTRNLLKKVQDDSPLVLLPDEVLLGEVDQVDHRLGRDEQMFVQDFDLKIASMNRLVIDGCALHRIRNCSISWQK